MPTAFYRSDVTCIQVLLNLVTILVIRKSHGGAIMSFENILGDVPDRIGRHTYFAIDMTVVSKERKSVDC